jgi:1,4-dihydroxy-2-naphthoate octaprenyltransferase
LIDKFLDYIEIKTKITSTFAFLYSVAFLFYCEYRINWKLTIIFFVAMFTFDLTTTAINNYIDTKTNHQVLQFKRKAALSIILVLFAASASLGLYLAYLTDVVVLILGGICFGCGILYTYGPVPISRQPLGEIFSGIFYGLFIPFLIMYINTPEGTILDIDLSTEAILIKMKIMPIISILLLSVSPVFTTANIMLANNICDLDKDVMVKRYTLPYYLGNKALYLFSGLYYMTYLSTIIMVIVKILPSLCLISLFTIFSVRKNIGSFFKVQDKSKTFILAIKNYIAIMGMNTLMIFISGLIY